MSFKNISLFVLRSAVLKIIVGIVVCVAVPEFFKSLLPRRNTIIPPEWYSLVILMLLTGTYFLLFRIWERRKITELGFKKFGLNSAGAFLLGFAVISIVMFVLFVLGNYKIISSNQLSMLSGTFMFFLMMSAMEEVIIRGILYRITEEKIGTNFALIISSFLFSILHLNNDHFDIVSLISLILGGLLMGLVYTNTRSLWAVIFAHQGWNFAQSFLGATVSGSSRLPKFLNAEFSGADWLSGGGFGPENSYITILILLILVVFFYQRSKRNYKFVPFRRTV